MSRASDTRQRTREAAAQLVALGKRPHELTVDSIYAEIKQGSRTTINDELKAWKYEEAKAAALDTSLPPILSNAIRSLWTLAMEQANQSFEQRREEVENALTVAVAQTGTLERSLATEQDKTAQLGLQLASRQTEVETLRAELMVSRSATDKATVRLQAAEQQILTERNEAEKRSRAARSEAEDRYSLANAEHLKREAGLQALIASNEKQFREEIDRAGMRLESMQNHMLMQVAEARDASKRLEVQLGKAARKHEELAEKEQRVRMDLGSLQFQFQQTYSDLAKAVEEARLVRSERDSLAKELALLTGRLDARIAQIESLERRAMGAESRLEEALIQSALAVRQEEKTSANAAGQPQPSEH